MIDQMADSRVHGDWQDHSGGWLARAFVSGGAARGQGRRVAPDAGPGRSWRSECGTSRLKADWALRRPRGDPHEGGHVDRALRHARADLAPLAGQGPPRYRPKGSLAATMAGTATTTTVQTPSWRDSETNPRKPSMTSGRSTKNCHHTTLENMPR